MPRLLLRGLPARRLGKRPSRCAAARGCGTLFTGRLPSSPGRGERLRRLLPRRQPSDPRLRGAASGGGGRRIRAIPATRGRWLDVGCGAGALMRAAAGRGWTAVGTEVAPRALPKPCGPDGFEVHLGELEALGSPEQSFDVVTLVEVVEHVPEPARPGSRPPTRCSARAARCTSPRRTGGASRRVRSAPVECRGAARAPPALLASGPRGLAERTPGCGRARFERSRESARAPRGLRRHGCRDRQRAGRDRLPAQRALSGKPARRRRKDAANAVLNAVCASATRSSSRPSDRSEPLTSPRAAGRPRASAESTARGRGSAPRGARRACGRPPPGRGAA